MKNTRTMMAAMMGMALMGALNTKYAEILTDAEHIECEALAKQLIEGNTEITKKQEILIEKILNRN